MLNIGTDMQSYDGYLMTVHWFEGSIVVITQAESDTDSCMYSEWTWYHGGIRPLVERF